MSSFVKASGDITPNSADPGEEFPFLHTITVVDRVVSVDKPELVQNNIKTETVTLNLDSEWEGLSCIINIGSGETPTSLIWNGQPVTIPAELMTNIGTLNVSVVGYGGDGALRAVTKKADALFTVVASGYVEGDDPVPDPTTILGQLTEAADRANQAAQNADDSTIDKVDVTMLPTGSDPSGSVSDKTLSLNIPQGPKGDPGDLTTVAHDASLYGDGTISAPLGLAEGTALTPKKVNYNGAVDLNELIDFGIYYIRTANASNGPEGALFYGTVWTMPCGNVGWVTQLAFRSSSGMLNNIYSRVYSGTWKVWRKLDTAWTNVTASSAQSAEYTALKTRVQALEAKLANQ